MEIGKLTQTLNKWQFDLKISAKDNQRFGFYPFISIWIINFHTLPPFLAMIEPKHYRGTHFVIQLPWPYVFSWHQTKMFAVWIGWDRKPMPKWIPVWVLMSDWRAYQPKTPRKFLITILTKRFNIPTKIKFF